MRLVLAVALWLPIAAGAQAGAVAAPRSAATGPSNAAEGMPAPGTRWRYTYRDQQYRGPVRNFTVEIVSVEGSRVQELFAVDGGEITQGVFNGEQLRFNARPVSGTDSVLEFAPYAPALYARKGATASGYPPAAGELWQLGRPTYAEVSIAVPAGTFATLRVEIKGTSMSTGAGTTAAHLPAAFTYTAWYSPQARRYVRSRHQVWNRFGSPIGDELVQLLEFQAPKDPR